MVIFQHDSFTQLTAGLHWELHTGASAGAAGAAAGAPA